MRTTNLKHFAGLVYVTVTNVPVKSSEFGDIIDYPYTLLEQMVSKALVEQKIPLRGREFKLIKSGLRMSNDKIAGELGISRNTVLKWSRNPDQKLPAPYEMLFRLLAAEHFNIKLGASFSDFKSKDKSFKISIDAAA